ncbi:MAG: Rieske 2Fe-2S domain-containing protein [Pirellulales bacterium]|nr:Rieske 2Fe-2S domain-containing protein [Pirellulales bacterium]
MERRRFLTWLCRTIAALLSAVVALPGIAFILAPLQQRRKESALVQRLCLLDDLAPGVPQEQVLTGNRRDAWTLYPRETLGRVWLVRRSGPEMEPAKAQVDAYSTICPHLGCEIGLDSSGKEFYCPCHKAHFFFSGELIPTNPQGEKNPSPRAMDSLKCHVVQDDDSGEWWIEVAYQKFEMGTDKKIAKG